MSNPVDRLERRAQECEALANSYREASGPVPLVRIEILEALDDGGHQLVDREFNGCRWRPTGSEPLRDVVLDVGGSDA